MPYVVLKVSIARIFVRALDKMLDIDTKSSEGILMLIDSLKSK